MRAHIHSLGASTAKEKGFVSPAHGRRRHGTLYERWLIGALNFIEEMDM